MYNFIETYPVSEEESYIFRENPPKYVFMQKRPTRIEDLPMEIIKEILLKAEYSDMYHFCQTNKQFAGLCNDKFIWNAFLKRDFGLLYSVENPKRIYELILEHLPEDRDELAKNINKNLIDMKLLEPISKVLDKNFHRDEAPIEHEDFFLAYQIDSHSVFILFLDLDQSPSIRVRIKSFRSTVLGLTNFRQTVIELKIFKDQTNNFVKFINKAKIIPFDELTDETIKVLGARYSLNILEIYHFNVTY